jgi:hypothetical protein
MNDDIDNWAKEEEKEKTHTNNTLTNEVGGS